jgi:predicted O-methyltransferase YrrM
MTCPDLRPAFPHTAELLVDGHVHLHDVDFDTECGYVSAQEARLLYAIAASRMPGRWIELGSHTGWSAAHVAAAGWYVTAVDPRFAEPDFRRRASENLDRAGASGRVVLTASTSEERLTQSQEKRLHFSGAFVDGDHEHPLRDAQLLLPWLSEQAVVVFHDHVGQPVRDAVAWLAEQGFHVRVYDTSREMAVCWRGGWEPPELQP